MKHQHSPLCFGDPAELPVDMRKPLVRSAADVGNLLPWKPRARGLREAVIYGTYTAQEWRLEDCRSTVDQIQRAAVDLVGHVGVALLSGGSKCVLWKIEEVELLAGHYLPLPSVSERPRNVRIAFAARCFLPGGVLIGREIRTATKCYVGCRLLHGNLGIFGVQAEERRRAGVPWRDRIDGTRVFRSTRTSPRFYFASWRPEPVGQRSTNADHNCESASVTADEDATLCPIGS